MYFGPNMKEYFCWTQLVFEIYGFTFAIEFLFCRFSIFTYLSHKS